MKKIYMLVFPAGVVAFAMLMAGFGGGTNTDYPVGAPPGYTNSPGDALNCTHCMGGTAVAVADWITSDIPATGYVPGITYSIMVTATGDGNKGFELSPQDPAGNLLGTLIAGSESKLVGGGKYVTHTLAATENPKSWIFQWTAPSTSVGAITFYACAVVGQFNTKTTTMIAPQASMGLTDLRSVPVSVYPNPVLDKLTVSFSLVTAASVTLELLSPQGKRICILFDGMCSAGEQSMEFRVDANPGVYLLRIRSQTWSHVSKLLFTI